MSIDIEKMPVVRDTESAEAFIRWCCREIGIGFHPDTRFKNYVEASGAATFDDASASRLEREISWAFNFLDDPYKVALDELKRTQR